MLRVYSEGSGGNVYAQKVKSEEKGTRVYICISISCGDPINDGAFKRYLSVHITIHNMYIITFIVTVSKKKIRYKIYMTSVTKFLREFVTILNSCEF